MRRPYTLFRHIEALRACRACPTVVAPPVVGPPVEGPKLMLVGQAPGPREPLRARLFAHTAGTRLFSWFAELGVSEDEFRARVWMAATIRCFPGRSPGGGDRVPSPVEIATCRPWLEHELTTLRPLTVIAVGRLAMASFLPPAPVVDRVGKLFTATLEGHRFEVVPLPHPSGRSTWLNKPGNRPLLARALRLLVSSAGWRATF